jgi:hypothetical protein
LIDVTYQELPVWARPSEADELYVYYTPASIEVSDEQIADAITALASDGACGIIPRLSPAVDAYTQQHRIERVTDADKQTAQRQAQAALESEQDALILAYYRRVYRVLVRCACACHIKIAFHPEKPLERMVVRASENGKMRACMLTRREYYLNQEEHVQLTLSNKGQRVALVAVDLRDGDTRDLRRDMTGEHELQWDVPTGNWCVQEFLCCEDPVPNANYLNYDAARAFLEESFALFADLFAGENRAALGALYLDDIGYHAPNRRSWSFDFNEIFTQLHGDDAAPCYPHVYEHEDHRTPHIKALMQQTRAHMLQNGIYRALRDVADVLGVRLLCSALESKLSAPSAISGDVLANQAAAPGAVLSRAYLYGLHSLKIASAGAINYGKSDVSCELCRDYASGDADVLYRETMHALVRGCNLLLTHTDGCAPEDRAAYLGFARRASALLRRGRSVSDIAVLYPIHALHASVSFYESAVQGFEFPGMPSFADYTSLIQSIVNSTGRDVALLHPDVLCDRAAVEDGQLLLKGENGTTYFDVLVLPSASMLTPQMARLAKEFFVGGGKLLSTGELLPHRAFCHQAGAAGEDADAEIASCMSDIFGGDALAPSVVARILIQENAAGGQASWLYPWQTAADGTMIVDSETVTRTLDAFAVPPDVEIPALRRYRECGVLGMSYPEFSGLNLPWVLPHGGVLEYTHKRCGQNDMYYFVNTRDQAFAGDVFLRGVHKTLHMYDPMTERTWEAAGEMVLRHDCSYTRFTLELPKVSSLFVFA